MDSEITKKVVMVDSSSELSPPCWPRRALIFHVVSIEGMLYRDQDVEFDGK